MSTSRKRQLFLLNTLVVVALAFFTYLWWRYHDPRVAYVASIASCIIALINLVLSRQQSSAQRNRDAGPQQVDAAVRWLRQDVTIRLGARVDEWAIGPNPLEVPWTCLLYTSDAAD